MEQVDIIEDSHVPAAQVVTIVLPSIPHDETGGLQATAGSYGSSQQEAGPLGSHELPLAPTTIQLTQVQSAVPLAVLKEDLQAPDGSENANLVVVSGHHHEPVTVAAALAHQPEPPDAAAITAHHQDPYHHHHHHHHQHNHNHQQHHHHNNNQEHDEQQDHDHHPQLHQKRAAGGASAKSRTRFKWTKESAQVALNLVKHGCKPVLVSVAVGCSLRTAQKFVEIVKPKMEGDAFKDYEIKRRGRKSRDVNQRLEAIREVLSKDVSKTQVQIAADLKVSNTTVCRDIKRIGASWKRNESSASAEVAATADQTTLASKGDPTNKRQPASSNTKSSRAAAGTGHSRPRRNTLNNTAAAANNNNNNDNQADPANTTSTVSIAANNNATTTTNTNTTTTTTSATTTNVAPKHELAQQVHV